jgi:hypothetical protein
MWLRETESSVKCLYFFTAARRFLCAWNTRIITRHHKAHHLLTTTSLFNLFHMFTTLFLKGDSIVHCHSQENFKVHSVIFIFSSYLLQKICNVDPNFEREHKLRMIDNNDNKFAQESIWT